MYCRNSSGAASWVATVIAALACICAGCDSEIAKDFRSASRTQLESGVNTIVDGLLDGVELGPDPSHPVDTDGDGIIDALDQDDDGDGIPTATSRCGSRIPPPAPAAVDRTGLTADGRRGVGGQPSVRVSTAPNPCTG